MAIRRIESYQQAYEGLTAHNQMASVIKKFVSAELCTDVFLINSNVCQYCSEIRLALLKWSFCQH